MIMLQTRQPNGQHRIGYECLSEAISDAVKWHDKSGDGHYYAPLITAGNWDALAFSKRHGSGLRRYWSMRFKVDCPALQKAVQSGARMVSQNGYEATHKAFLRFALEVQP